MAAGVTDRLWSVEDLVALLGSLRAAEGGKSSLMREYTERWMELARLASTEQDPVKLLALITEINQLLMKKEERLIKAESLKLENSK
jgi:hypothetical protein